jgi:hypothetical protein
VTTSTFDKLVVTQTPTGSQISGFVTGETQARLVFTRRGEQMEIVCMTEDLACAQLAVIETLSSWQLVSARLEPYRRGELTEAAEDEAPEDEAAEDEGAPDVSLEPAGVR